MACMYGIDLQSKFPEKFPYEKDLSGELTFFQFCLENYIYENKLELDQLLEKMKADSYFCHDLRKSVIEYYIKKIAEFSQEPDRRFYSHMLLCDSDALVKNALENIIKYKDFFVSFEDLIQENIWNLNWISLMMRKMKKVKNGPVNMKVKFLVKH